MSGTVGSAPHPREKLREPETTESEKSASQNGKDLTVPEIGGEVYADWAKAEVLGTSDPRLVRQLADQLQNCLSKPKNMDQEKVFENMAAALEVIKSIAPRDPIEAMLAVQLIAVHHAAMECFRRAVDPGQTTGQAPDLRFAEKFVRLFREQLEALEHRRLLPALF